MTVSGIIVLLSKGGKMSNKGGNVHITLVCLSLEKLNNRRRTSTGLKTAILCMSFGDKEWLERQHNTGYLGQKQKKHRNYSF